MPHLISGMSFLNNFTNLLMMSLCHCYIILHFIIIIIITTFNMHHSSLLQTQNLPFPQILPTAVSRTFSDKSRGFLRPFPHIIFSVNQLRHNKMQANKVKNKIDKKNRK